MKFGLFIDKTAQESFSIIDGKSYTLEGEKPYSTHNSIENYTHMSIFQYPFLFNDNGYHINLKKTQLPDIDFDVIFLVREMFFDEFPISLFRKKYPNAKIFGVLKEQYFVDENRRCKALAECDEILLPFSHKYIHYQYQQYTNRSTTWLPHPYDINYLYNKFYNQERTHDIFSYISPTVPELRRANTEQFTQYMAHKYNLSVKRIKTDNWTDFMKELSTCKFIFNLDPTQGLGNTGIQSAILGVCGIGSALCANMQLFPNTYGTHFDHLENEFVKLNNDSNLFIEYIQNSFNIANDIYSMDSVKKQIITLYNK